MKHKTPTNSIQSLSDSFAWCLSLPTICPPGYVLASTNKPIQDWQRVSGTRYVCGGTMLGGLIFVISPLIHDMSMSDELQLLLAPCLTPVSGGLASDSDWQN